MSKRVRILVTCPPMLGMIDEFQPLFEHYNLAVTAPKVVQTASVQELIDLVPKHEGWVIGDDPATRPVFEAGVAGSLRAAVKWGIGVDNIDFQACEDLGIRIANTPGMFGAEVADMALGYVIALARQTFDVDRAVRAGKWMKPSGISLKGRTAALVGYGNIGRESAKRLRAVGMHVIAYDPFVPASAEDGGVERAEWPDRLSEADFLVLTCALTPSSRHMVNSESLARTKPGVRVVNVGRGPVVDETALAAALRSGQVYSAALDVFEVEPLPEDSYLRVHPRCILGSHNSSNTIDAVVRTSEMAVRTLVGFLS
jgi:D-3-phosphoglycerate dehydrogenase / 2-oxoglutarate reductase